MSAPVLAYLRVSTADQTTANQRGQVLALAAAVAARHPGSLVEVVEDVDTGSNLARPGWVRVRREVRARRVVAVVAWALDRLGRTKIDLSTFHDDCRTRGVELATVREPWVSSVGPVGSLLVDVFAWVAEQERARLIERTNAGLDRVRREGSASGLAIGRPRVPASALAEAAAKCRVEQGSGFHSGRGMVWTGVEAAARSTMWERPGPKGKAPVRVPVSVSSLRRYLRSLGAADALKKGPGEPPP